MPSTSRFIIWCKIIDWTILRLIRTLRIHQRGLKRVPSQESLLKQNRPNKHLPTFRIGSAFANPNPPLMRTRLASRWVAFRKRSTLAVWHAHVQGVMHRTCADMDWPKASPKPTSNKYKYRLEPNLISFYI